MSHPTRLAATDEPGLLARSAALAAAGCGLAHGVMVAAAPTGWTAVTQAALTAACLPCAGHLWRQPRPTAWAMHVALALAMLLGHPLILAFGAHVHVHGPSAGWAGTAMPLLAGLGLLLAAWRWWLGCDVGLQTSSSAIAGPGRRVPQA